MWRSWLLLSETERWADDMAPRRGMLGEAEVELVVVLGMAVLTRTILLL
jgi:hypothetical protein